MTPVTHFQMAIEKKQGVTQMDIFYEQLVKEKAAKEQKREKLRLKRKLKKERRNEIEEKENTCEVKFIVKHMS